MTDFPTLLYTSTRETPTLSYTWSMKKVLLSAGASPYRPSYGVPLRGTWKQTNYIISKSSLNFQHQGIDSCKTLKMGSGAEWEAWSKAETPEERKTRKTLSIYTTQKKTGKTTGSPSSKYEHRRASALLRNIQNIRICMGKKLDCKTVRIFAYSTTR